MHWKIHRDAYYRELHPLLGEAGLAEAGFFHDTATSDASLDDVRLLCTPTPASFGGERPAVLVSTGSFCPVHEGHLAMMHAARDVALRAGYDVLAGYLSPGHDEYVGGKCGAGALPSSERLDLCAAAAAGASWLLVDPWEALHRDCAVNFTDVLVRLELYLRHHLGREVAVIYVAGADNARFALTFARRGACVVVGRPGHAPALARYRAHPLLRDNPRVLWAEGAHAASSSARRAAAEGANIVEGAPSLRLRLEDGAAVRHLGLPAERWTAFQGGLRRVLSAELDGRLRAIPLAEQRAGLAAGATARPLLSLDPMLPAAQNLALSRLFDLGGYSPRGHVARPGAPPLGEQIARIPPGEYALLDDDRATGGTLAAVRAALPESVRVGDVVILGTAEHPAEDIADSRDFLLGADDAGLVVRLPDGSLGRAPYALPYVDPAARCGLPPRGIHELSRRVWELNHEAFDGTALRVADLPPASRRAMVQAGFGADDALSTVAAWHARRMAAPGRG